MANNPNMSVNDLIYINGKRYTVNREKLSNHGYIELTVGHKQPCERVVTAPLDWWRFAAALNQPRVFISGEWLSKQPDKEENMTDCNSIPIDPYNPDQHTPGAKNDQDKMDLSLLEFLADALIEVTRVMDYGQTKYTRGGFLEVPDGVRRYTSAMLRHWLKESSEKFDSGDPFYETEEGKPFEGTLRHDAQVAVNALFRLQCKINEEKTKGEYL